MNGGGYHPIFNVDKEILENLYCAEGMTCREIGGIFGTHADTILKKLRLYRIPRRPAGMRPRFDITRELLVELYCERILGTGMIAKMLGASLGTIEYHMKKHGVPMRPQPLAASAANKGKIGWSKGLTKETHPSLKSLSERYKGPNSLLFGKYGPDSPAFGWRHTDEWKREASIRAKQFRHTDASKEILREKQKALWQDPVYKDRAVKILREAQQKRPTQGELALIDLFNRYNLPYKYVGDGAVVIYGLNPDFINYNGQKKIIEFFGSYWHNDRDDLPYERTEEGRKEVFAQLGYQTLVIWDHELQDLDKLLSKICLFTHSNAEEDSKW